VTQGDKHTIFDRMTTNSNTAICRKTYYIKVGIMLLNLKWYLGN